MTEGGGERVARELDAADPLSALRERFAIPPSRVHADGRASVYLCGNSLGCMPRSVVGSMEEHLRDWADLGVDGHFEAGEPWYDYHEGLREPMARVVGALPHEVVAMNSLTVNLHLLMVSFYRPEGERDRILIDGPCFPSDVYAVKSHIRARGLDPEACLVWAGDAREPGAADDGVVERAIRREGERLALVLLAGVNYLSGRWHDMARLTRAAHEVGAIAGWDLAHAAGNVPVSLHDSGADFAAWCTYKYLNGGPGAVAGAFVHERWTREQDASAYRLMPRYEGWWGNDPVERFRMEPEFEPVRSADAWSLSNPPILSMVPVKRSLEVFDEVGMDRLRARSERLTGYLASAIGERAGGAVELITPNAARERGCQLSLRVRTSEPRAVFEGLKAAGVVCDYREPGVIRVAPTPLYNTFHDCWVCAEAIGEAVRAAPAGGGGS